MAPKTPPGQTRAQIYGFVRDKLLKGLPPTVREVQRAFGFCAVQTAREHLETLVAEGKLDKEPGKARGYRLPSKSGPGPFAFVPLLGRVQAGALTTAVEDPEGYVPVQGLRDGDGLFALRVRGESMTGAGILPGDLVIVRSQPTADSGDIVVALVEDEATVKRLRRKGDRIELHPENSRFEPIVPNPDSLALLGKVIEVRRYLEEG
ncbi:MAG: repressor LexA [Proteobacteria bacterium]|nr:repressor LexA [Pseudomonadota bacterium]